MAFPQRRPSSRQGRHTPKEKTGRNWAAWVKVLDAEKVVVRSANPNKTMRMSMADGKVVALGFTAKGDAKSAVAIQHSKLPDRGTADRTKAWWAERFDALAEVLT